MTNPLLNIDLGLPSSNTLDIPDLEIENDQDLQNQIITFYEARFWLESKIPTKEEVRNRFNLSSREYENYYDSISEPLENRLGIKLKPLKTTSPVKDRGPEFELDPVFTVACSIICDTADKRATAAKLKQLGLSTKQWQALLTIPAHKIYFEKKLDLAFGGIESSAKLALGKNVEAGDLQSIKYYMEYSGKYRPASDNLINIAFLLGRLMEVLSQYVTPEELSKIADEFDSVLTVKELTDGN